MNTTKSIKIELIDFEIVVSTTPDEDCNVEMKYIEDGEYGNKIQLYFSKKSEFIELMDRIKDFLKEQ